MAAQGGARPDPVEVSNLAAGPTAGRPSPAGTGRGATRHLRITRGRLEPATYDELVGPAQDLAAAVKRPPGCGGYHGGVDRAAGTLAAVSTWDSAEHARFSREALGDALTQTLGLDVRLESPEIYEVVASA